MHIGYATVPAIEQNPKVCKTFPVGRSTLYHTLLKEKARRTAPCSLTNAG